MQALAHPDPVVLESALLDRLERAHPPGASALTLVLVPTSRLREHVLRRMAERRAAWLGVDVLNFRQAELRAIAATAPRPLRSLGSGLRRAILRRELGRMENDWSAFVHRRPRTLGRIARALDDLREAGIDPETVAAEAEGETSRLALAEVFAAYDRAIARLSRRGWCDGPGVAAAARGTIEPWSRRYGNVFLHGAYELVGSHLDLVREIDRATRFTVFLPVSPRAPASRFAEAWAREFLLRDDSIDSLGPPVPGRPALERLYDRDGEPAATPGFFSHRHVQGVEAEVREAVRGAVADVREGVPPVEIAIVARTLEPYAAALERALSTEGIPWTSSIAGPLRRQPFVRDFLAVLEIADLDFPRSRTAQLLRSPRVRWPPGERPPGDRADVWSRRARILGGIEEWTDHLPRWVEHSGPGRDRDGDEPARAAGARADASRIARAVDRIARDVPRAPATWSAHARGLRTLFDERILVGEDDPAATSFVGILDEMALLETLLDERGPVSFAEARTWLELAVDASEVPCASEDCGGIRVLDVLQLRGLTFRRIHFLGMNEGLFPRPPREDAVLPDRVRERLRRATGRPLPIASRAPDEERLLLSLTLGAARERVAVSWQRAEESGKARTPSLALREIARLATGRATLDEVLERPEHHVPSHPEHALRHAVSASGLLSPREERVLAALVEPDTAALCDRFAELAPGLAMIAATQSFDATPGPYDGRIGPLGPLPRISVGALERLGACPQRFLFHDVLGVRELDREADAQQMDHGELGRNVHDVLHAVYRALVSEGLLGTATSERRIARALALLDVEIGRLFGTAGERLHRRLPVLWRETARAWREAIAAFLRFDLDRWSDRTMAGLEESCEGSLSLGEGVEIALRGRFDRRVDGAEGAVVCDYKTGADPTKHVDPTPMVKGVRLQVALYGKLADCAVEILPVGPKHAREPSVHSFSLADQKPEFLRALDDTLRTVVRLYEAGTFPFRETDGCRWCEYTAACRKEQPASVERESRAADAAALRTLDDRSARTPFPTGSDR